MSDDHLRRLGKKHAFTSSQGFYSARSGVAATMVRRLIVFGYYDLIERHVPAAARVLDFGCGGGTAWLAKRYRVTGLEANDVSVQAALNLYTEAVIGDVCKTPFQPNSLDAVVSKFVLEHLPEEATEEALPEIIRILKPGGYFISLCDL